MSTRGEPMTPMKYSWFCRRKYHAMQHISGQRVFPDGKSLQMKKLLYANKLFYHRLAQCPGQ